MTVFPANMSSNATALEDISSYDRNGSIIYIVVVIIWYALGFGLILIDDINPQPGRDESHRYVSVYETVTDLHEQQALNDILVELKDADRRTKLWQIYYGTQKTHPVMVQKDKESIELIKKQLSDLNERRRLLRSTLNEISVDYADGEHSHDDSDGESVHSFQTMNRSRSSEHLRSYIK